MDKKFQKALSNFIDDAFNAKLEAVAAALDLDFSEVKKAADSVATDVKKSSPKGRKAKKDVDPDAPKKPMTAFFMFASAKSQEIIDEVKRNPDKKYKDKSGNTFKVKKENYGKDGVKLQRPIISKIAGSMWAELGEDGRRKWKEKSDKLKEQYEKDLDAYNEEHGIEKKPAKKPAKKSTKKVIKTPSIVEDSDEEDIEAEAVVSSSSDEEVVQEPEPKPKAAPKKKGKKGKK